ncbi:glycine cleavage system H protein [Bifidobacterium reuteri DSM 23975]|uniref:Glycine cleavage system H protein n=1 Tax=Bifidobacterium reuteri DSM 23975 TaxID=1437610 RepID=A0A087CXL3_9BIFI|nr:glycine cleavage system protein GcvH [Bifidobacterium reuteri]KFI88013.1 glycine cleavage system H protein [Bifidobacterium reuteri DSM 23975]
MSETSETEDNEQPLNLDIPEHLEYSDEHVWVDRSDEDLAILGITEYAADQLGELVFVDLPEPGSRVEAGDEIVELESSKAVQPMISPVAGTVKYVNRDVSDDPSVINGDPYGEGWILKVELDDDEPELLSADEYAKIIRWTDADS